MSAQRPASAPYPSGAHLGGGTGAVSARLLYTGLLGGFTAWGSHLILVFWIVSGTCPSPPPFVHPLLLAATAVAALVAAASALLSWWCVQRLRRSERPFSDAGAEPPRAAARRRGVGHRAMLLLLALLGLRRARSRRGAAGGAGAPRTTASAWDASRSFARRQFLAVNGVLHGGLACLTLLAEGYAIAVLGPCG